LAPRNSSAGHGDAAVGLAENKTSKSNGGGSSGNVAKAKHINHKNFKCAKLVCQKAVAATAEEG